MSGREGRVTVGHNPVRNRSQSKNKPPQMGSDSPELDRPDISGGVKMNLVVCGSDGTLKSSISEWILQQTDRRSDVEFHGHLISPVELPALIGLSEEEVMHQTLRCLSLCHPGVHVFLLIIPDSSLTNEDKAEMEEIRRIFSSRVNKHIMILIMQNSEHQTTDLNEETQSVIESFGGRHYFFGPKPQVSMLMENIEQMLEENRGGFFSIETFLEAHMKKLMEYEEMKRKINSLETCLLPQGSTENEDDLRIVLLGKTGVGKSATGNTILGRDVFAAEESFESVTKESQKETSEINSRHINVIDTPGLFDTELTNEEIQREISNCISMILPGPHVFLLLIPLGRFTKHEETSVKIIQETFGEKSLMYTMVLFTRGDDLKNKTIDQCFGKPESVIRKLIEACGNRYHVFNNNQTGDRTQVSDLLEKIDNMVKENGGSFYSCKMFRQMEREKQEQQMKIMMERLEQMNREREELMKKHEEEMKIERETLINEIEGMRQEKEKIKSEKDKLWIKYDTERDRLMKRIENERKNHDKERKRREEKFNEIEKQYKTLMKEKDKSEENMHEEIKRERKQWEKQKLEEKTRREEEDEKRREKEQRVWDEFNEKLKQERERMERMKEDLQSKHEAEENKMKTLMAKREREREELMQKHEEEKERIERERQGTLEYLEKRLKEEISMREDQQNSFDEIVKLLEKQHEDELKTKRVEWREEHDREERKKKVCSDTDDPLQLQKVTAYRKLETEYSEWSWSLHSAMMEIEDKLHNKIENEKIHVVKETDLQRELKNSNEEVEKFMSEFFEKDTDADVLFQWKTSFEIKIKKLQQSIVRETNKKLNEILQHRDQKKTIDDQRTNHENTLYEKSKELALKLKDKTKDKETLKKEFDLFWEQSVKRIIRDTPAIKDIDIMRDVKDILSKNFEGASVNMRESRDIFSVQSYSEYVSFKKFPIKGIKEIVKDAFGFVQTLKDEAPIRSLVKDVAQQSDRKIQSFNISKMGYNISYIQQLTHYIKKRVTEHQEGSVKYVFKNEFFMDLVYSICKRANKMITDQHRLFRDTNDPVIYVEKKREEYYSIFQRYCHGATSAAIFGEIICQKLKEPIEQSVYKKTARNLTDEMRTNCPSLNGNRLKLEKHILKTLAEEGDFHKYMNYIDKPRDHFQSFIRDEVSRYITGKFSVSVLPKMKENIKLLQQKIIKAAHESTEHVQVNSGDVGLWLKSFTHQLSDELVFSEKDLSGVKHEDVEDFNLLEDVMNENLPATVTDISRELKTEKLDPKFRPDEILIDHFCQCCWVQCPFCGATCTNTIENHHGDHSVHLHRNNGLNGWFYKGTTNLSVEICTSAVASDKSFYHNESDYTVLWKKYRRAGGVYADWSITPDLSELPYWKWFVCKFQKDLEKYYSKTFEGSGNILKEWKKYTIQNAIESLDYLLE